MNSLKDKLTGQHEIDTEILRLEEQAQLEKESPSPQIDLARGYLARIQNPPNWNQNDAKKALAAFHKAAALAHKSAPAQARTIQEMETSSLMEIASNYYTYHDANPDLKLLEEAIWLLEHALSDAGEQPERVAEIEEQLCDCWRATATWHENEVEAEEAKKHEYLNKVKAAVEKALNYARDPEIRQDLDTGLAIDQIIVGKYYVELAGESTAFGAGSKLIKVNDKEHKGYANLAIRLLDEGRRRLQKYPKYKDYADLMDGANTLLATAYIYLFNMTYAHSKGRQSIGILKRGVASVPQSPELWHALGESYKDMGIEYKNEVARGLETGHQTWGYGGCASIILFIPTTLRVNSLNNKGEKCLAKEVELQNNPGDLAFVPDKGMLNLEGGDWPDYAKSAYLRVSALVGLPLLLALGNWFSFIPYRDYSSILVVSTLIGLMVTLVVDLVILGAKKLPWQPLLLLTLGYVAIRSVSSSRYLSLMSMLQEVTTFTLLIVAAKLILKEPFEAFDFKRSGFFALAAAGLGAIFAIVGLPLSSEALVLVIISIVVAGLAAFGAALVTPWLSDHIRHY